MFDFVKVLADLRALKDAIQSGSLGDILVAAGPVVSGAGWAFKSFGMTAATGPDHACYAEIVSECDAVAAALSAFEVPVEAPDPALVAAWGDGTILRAFLAALPVILEIIKKFVL